MELSNWGWMMEGTISHHPFLYDMTALEEDSLTMVTI